MVGQMGGSGAATGSRSAGNASHGAARGGPKDIPVAHAGRLYLNVSISFHYFNAITIACVLPAPQDGEGLAAGSGAAPRLHQAGAGAGMVRATLAPVGGFGSPALATVPLSLAPEAAEGVAAGAAQVRRVLLCMHLHGGSVLAVFVGAPMGPTLGCNQHPILTLNTLAWGWVSGDPQNSNVGFSPLAGHQMAREGAQAAVAGAAAAAQHLMPASLAAIAPTHQAPLEGQAPLNASQVTLKRRLTSGGGSGYGGGSGGGNIRVAAATLRARAREERQAREASASVTLYR